MLQKHTKLNSVDHTANVQELNTAWQRFLTQNDWQSLITHCTPILSNNGLIYELPNYLARPNESFALVDMRNIGISEPHYHPSNDIEVYMVLQGTACVVIGNKEHPVKQDDILVIPPYHAHYTIPDKQFVMAVVNTPPYEEAHYIVVTQSDESVQFDLTQYNQWCVELSCITK